MTAYVDSSVLLRVVLGQPNALPEWSRIRRGISSVLTRVESLRTLDRLRLRVPLTDVEVARRRSSILRLLDSFELAEMDSVVLDRASQPLPTELGTLDAIHLATRSYGGTAAEHGLKGAQGLRCRCGQLCRLCTEPFRHRSFDQTQ
jgi:predicted nucleic acid-binding protein